MSDSPETQRIKEVYQSYHADSSKQADWSRENRGNQAILTERRRVFQRLLRHHVGALEDKQILEIGCGGGQVLADFLLWGAEAGNLHGVDLLPDRIEAARARYPDFRFECANAENLDFPDSSFDLVLFSTVFSSILDQAMRTRVAAEAGRILKSGGFILWYDFRYNNPSNPHVRGVTSKDIRSLFPEFAVSLRIVTLLPPLARRLGSLTCFAYPVLSLLFPLRTHYLGLLRKP